MALTANNRVIIRIWTSKDHPQLPGANVGHVSIETLNTYTSLWPVPFSTADICKYEQANQLEQKILKYFGERKPHYMVSYQDDVQAEKGPAQLTFCLYSLNVQNLLQEFNTCKTNIQGWRLIGSNLLVKSVENTVNNFNFMQKDIDSSKKDVENCSSMAYRLLKAGGIYTLISSTYSSQFSSVVTPDDLAKAVMAAKEYELKEHPETQAFTFTGETNIDQLKKLAAKNNSLCLIM